MSDPAAVKQVKQAPQLAYEAYIEMLEGYLPVVEWEDLSPIHRQAWTAAAEAAIGAAKR